MCLACFEANPNALWLAWLRCVNTDQHKQESTIVVVVNSREKKLIKVRPLPLGFTQLEEVRRATHGGGACSSRSCQLAHSEDELLYWKWQVARNTIFMSVSSNCYIYKISPKLHQFYILYPSVLRLFMSM